MQNPPSPTPLTDGVEQVLCPDLLSLHTTSNGMIWIYTFHSRKQDAAMSVREVIDVWVQTMHRQVQDLPAGATWYRMHDFTRVPLNPPPYFIAKLAEVAKHRPDLRGYSAFVIPKSTFTQIMKNLWYRIRSKHVTVEQFFTSEEALGWLKKHLETNE